MVRVSPRALYLVPIWRRAGLGLLLLVSGRGALLPLPGLSFLHSTLQAGCGSVGLAWLCVSTL